jgi:hypothetical protein
MAILGAVKEWLLGKRIPGSPGSDCEIATVKSYSGPIILYVTKAGTFDVTPVGGTARTGLVLPVGIFPVYLDSIQDLGDGAGIAIYQ